MNRSLPGPLLHREGGVSYARALNNLRPYRGELARRPGTVAVANPPTLDTVAGETGDYPVVHLEELDLRPELLNRRYLLVTSKEAFIGIPGSWANVTPEYATGTVTVTNGSPNVTGNGTAWLTVGIYGGNWFKGPDGAFYKIASVTSDTALVLSENYAGTSAGPGASYLIRRTFNFVHGSGLVPHTARINEDLYLAGQVSGGLISGTTNAQDGGVLQIAGAYDNAVTMSPSIVTYIFSGRNDPSGSVDEAGDNFNVLGFGTLSDGRLVVAAHAYNLSTGLRAAARIYYSSHLNVAVWTTTPGGATDLIDHKSAITGALIDTTSATIHFEDGIEVAELTGQDDPPLRFRPSRAKVGATGPRLLIPSPGGPQLPGTEVFIASDLNLYSFNGIDASPVEAEGFQAELLAEAGGTTTQIGNVRSGFLVIDPIEKELALYFDRPGDTLTREVRWSYLTGQLWRGEHKGLISSAFFPAKSSLTSQVSPVYESLVLGTTTAQDWLYRLSLSAASDALLEGGTDTSGIYALFEGLSFGSPEAKKILKEILVYGRAPYHATPAATTLKLAWFSEEKTAGETKTVSVTPVRTSVGADIVRPEVVAIFNDLSALSSRSFDVQVGGNDLNSFPMTITRIVFDFEDAGDMRAL